MKSLFSFQGEISRGRFWLGVLTVDFVALLAYLAFVLLSFRIFPFFSGVGFSLAVVLSVPLVWVFLALCVKRLRDADLNPWLCPLVFVPLVGLVVFLIIGFKPTAVKSPGATTRS